MKTIDFDQVLVMVGDRGRYQTYMFFILCIPATLPVAFLAFSNVFTNATPDHWCQPPPKLKNLNMSTEDIKYLTIPFRIRGDGERVYSKCSMYDINSTDIYEHIFTIDNRTRSDLGGIDANDSFIGGKVGLNETSVILSESNIDSGELSVDDVWRKTFDGLIANGSLKTVDCKYGWVYDRTYYDDTLVTQMDLVCDNNWLPQTSTALFYVGSLFGNVIFGWVADRWGRRRAMMLMIVLEVLISIATCFSRDYKTYMIFRALGGFFFPALYQIPFILGIEMMGPSHRTFAGMLICMFFAGAMSMLALLAYFIRDWFRLSIATSVPFLMLFSYYWIIPESPRWLLSRGRMDEAEEILQTMARYNGTKIPKRFLHQLHEEANAVSPLLSKEGNKKNGVVNKSNTKQNMVTIDAIPKVVKIPSGIEANYRKRSEEYDAAEIQRLTNDFNDDDTETSAVDQSWTANRSSTNPLTNTAIGKISILKSANSKNTIERTDANQAEKIDGTSEQLNLKNRRSSELTNNGCGDLTCIRRMKSVCLQTDPIVTAEKQEATMFDIFRYPNIRKKFFLLTFDWIANAVVYNGLSYNATSLGVNDFLAFFIAAAIEIPSYMLSWWFMDRWGRRWVLCVALATGGIGCLSCMFVPEERVWITVTLAMIGKFGVAAAFSVFYVFVGELFPTVLRSQAMGLSSLLVSVGLLSFPYILQLSHYSKVLPLIILGVLSLSGSVVSLFLPETLNTPMPQTLEDGENFGKDFQIFSMPQRRKKRDCET